VAERWKKPGDEYNTQTLYRTEFQTCSISISDVLIESADYLKLRDVTLSYDNQKNGVALRGFNTAKVYFQGRNLLLLTKNSDRRDLKPVE